MFFVEVDRIFDALLHVHGLVVLAVVFLVPALEASTLIGIVMPGETAVFFGGVLARYGRTSIWWVVVASTLGAIVGDSIGYAIGARWGERIMKGRLGRLIGERRWARARRHLERKGFLVILAGRFPPAVRTLVPIAAGSAHMPYWRFAVGNVVGGTLWAVSSALLGYAAGDAWGRAERVQRIVGLALLGAVALVAALLALRSRRRHRHRPRHA
jgi:membrane-associated protein